MIDDFKPPIKSKTTKELIEIVGAPKKWNERALKLAIDELYTRKVDAKHIDQAKHIEKRQVEFEALKIAKERFNFFSYNPSHLFINWGEVFMFLFSWEYEKDGFLYKAKIQRKYRPFLLILILVIVICSSLL